MMNFLILVSTLFLVSCVTAPDVRPASEYLLVSDRGVSASLRDIRTKLEEQDYVVGREDMDAGFLILKPRKFTFNSGGRTVAARQSVQIRQEGGSIKLRMGYDCDYAGVGDTYTHCRQSDASARAKISRLERPLLKMLNTILQKRGGDGLGAVPVEIKGDEDK